MNLQALTELAIDGRIHELELLSLEGGIYVLRARLDGGLRTLLDESGKTLHIRSTTHLRELLRFVPRLPCTLVQYVVHDEMCGQREGRSSRCACHFSSTSPGSDGVLGPVQLSSAQFGSARRSARGAIAPRAVPGTGRCQRPPAARRHPPAAPHAIGQRAADQAQQYTTPYRPHGPGQAMTQAGGKHQPEQCQPERQWGLFEYEQALRAQAPVQQHATEPDTHHRKQLCPGAGHSHRWASNPMTTSNSHHGSCAPSTQPHQPSCNQRALTIRPVRLITYPGTPAGRVDERRARRRAVGPRRSHAR